MKRKLFVGILMALFCSVALVNESNATTQIRTSIFKDYSMKDFHYESVYSLYFKEGIEHKISDDGYLLIEPSRVVTRAEAAFMLYQLLGMSPENGMSFTDVNNSDWYADSISAITNKKIMIGYPDGSFNPNQPLTRAHMSKIVAKAFEYQIPTTVTNSFKDVPKEYEYFVEAIYKNNVTTGVTPTMFASQMPIPRNQMASILKRAYERIPSSVYNEFQVMNTINESTRKARILILQGIDKDASSEDMEKELSTITSSPYTEMALKNYETMCKACDGGGIIQDFDFALSFSIKHLSNTKIIVKSVVPETYFENGYRGTIELNKINGTWLITNLTKASFNEEPLNMTIVEALDYLPYSLSTYHNIEVETIEYLGISPRQEFNRFRVNNDVIIDFNLNTAWIEIQN